MGRSTDRLRSMILRMLWRCGAKLSQMGQSTPSSKRSRIVHPRNPHVPIDEPICLVCFEPIKRSDRFWLHVQNPHKGREHTPVPGIEFEHPAHAREFYEGEGFDFLPSR